MKIKSVLFTGLIVFTLCSCFKKSSDIDIYADDLYVDCDKLFNNKKTVFSVGYGSYPQTVVEDSQIISELNKLESSKTADKNGYYTFNDKQYAPLIAYPAGNLIQFSNGNYIEFEKKYWFEVETIYWGETDRTRQELDINAQHAELVLYTKWILDIHIFNDDYNGNHNGIYANDYSHSSLRNWLNNDFYKKAFSKNDKYIIESNLKCKRAKDIKMEYETGDSTYFNNWEEYYLNDKVYIASDEVGDLKQVGNDKDCRASGSFRKATLYPTDYALARGMKKINNEYAEWIRDPSVVKPMNEKVWRTDYVNNFVVDTTGIGVTPLITVKF
ncbi:MAG: hypothetical protein IJQ67_03495 [Bacilli bacterium]|nr:hypothetical protein [Bacilli bacterium]